MGNAFYVVSQDSANDNGYASAIVFDNTSDFVDNEALANDYLTEATGNRPWMTHSVVSADDFASKFDREPSDGNNVTSGDVGKTTLTNDGGDPAPVAASTTPLEG